MKLPKDTKLWAISVEGLRANAKFKKQNAKKGHPITFPLLWDMDGEIIHAFGLKDPRYKGHKYEGIPYPSTYIIGKNGKVVFAHVALNYTKRPKNDSLLFVLSQLNNQ
ncbi:MAG: redoxin domain-containing protein [Candidatus Marinimicrobia bacterium]|nr:redoxin domain-containing protein [Candidatus Neomarinimicrobiota bacterium]MBL7010337.1 redoxin domain-containing protein [Candidatus Neomarinimicrobiota bacterium]MBL7030035.1 redoxin domain-containing protein [Candidatus Neomarinimicrobiota bacterium]